MTLMIPCLVKTLISSCFSFKIPDVTERMRQDSLGRTRVSNLVFTIWAVFGGFILHFLLCNYLTVLLRPRYEKPVENVTDLIKRDITPFMMPGSDYYRQIFAASPDPNYREISQRLVIAKDWNEYDEMVRQVTSTGMYADIGSLPYAWPEEFKDWYKSSLPVAGPWSEYSFHLSNKKWPLKEVSIF